MTEKKAPKEEVKEEERVLKPKENKRPEGRSEPESPAKRQRSGGNDVQDDSKRCYYCEKVGDAAKYCEDMREAARLAGKPLPPGHEQVKASGSREGLGQPIQQIRDHPTMVMKVADHGAEERRTEILKRRRAQLEETRLKTIEAKNEEERKKKESKEKKKKAAKKGEKKGEPSANVFGRSEPGAE